MIDKYGIDKDILRLAVELADGQLPLARKIGHSQGDIWKWLNIPGRSVPATAIIPICEAVNWQITPHQLAPRIYPNAEDGMPHAVLRLKFEAA